MRYKGGVISATAPTTSTSTAKGVWTITQQMQAVNASTWPATPGAPTIGTATAVTSSTATVTYTAPTNLGAGTVTFTATSSPGSFTGTGASPITVAGLSPGTSYTFTVTASTPGGTGPASAASNSVTPTLAIGDAFGGGYYVGQISTTADGVATHYLVASPKSSGASTAYQFKTASTTDGSLLDSTINGSTNTNNVNDASHPAAQWARGLTIGGFSDWYIPSVYEQYVIYYFVKATNAANSTDSGSSNPYSVSPYVRNTAFTTGTPAQSALAAWQTGGAQAIDNASWTSTQAGGAFMGTAGQIYGPNLYNGSEDANNKANTGITTRVIRRVAV